MAQGTIRPFTWPQSFLLNMVSNPNMFLPDMRSQYLTRTKAMFIIGLIGSVLSVIAFLWMCAKAGRAGNFYCNWDSVELQVFPNLGQSEVTVLCVYDKRPINIRSTKVVLVWQQSTARRQLDVKYNVWLALLITPWYSRRFTATKSSCMFHSLHKLRNLSLSY